jgi:hypothetical protein
MGGQGERGASQAITPPPLHQRLGGQEAGLAVFVVDQRQPALVLLEGLVLVACAVRLDDGRMPSAKPPPVMALVAPAFQVGQQGDGFPPSHGPSMASPPRAISSRSLPAAPAFHLK